MSILKKVLVTAAFLMATFNSHTVLADGCKGYGPQTPRDLTKSNGSNPVHFNIAPNHRKLNLCNIHFHKNAEHKASGYRLSGGVGKFGGWRCNESNKISKTHLTPSKTNHCQNVSPGDTIEVHWVHSSCQVQPGKGLGACLSKSCSNPQLRVETKVFLVVNDDSALDFTKFGQTIVKNGYHQAASLPNRKDSLEFTGSTTGPNYSDSKCSPLQVTWNVSQSCDRVSLNSLSRWCKNNAFAENSAHGVRKIVEDPALLSKFKTN